jgi:hypothetical protein
MDLLKRYEAATSPTIAQVKTIGTESSPGVNFLDGAQRTRTPAIDTVQTEFTPNANGSFLYDGNGKVAGTYSLSRWLDAGIEKGDAYLSNTKFTTIVKGDVRNAAGTILHKYSQLQGKSFFDAAGLSPFAKSRANPNSNSYGPGVAGVNG